MDAESPRLRLSILGVVVLSLFGALFARLWYLQVMTSQQFQVQASSNTQREVFEDAPRGRIVDRFGTVLVDNRTSLVVTVNQHEFPDDATETSVLTELAHELTLAGVPTKLSAIKAKLADPQYNPLQPIPIAIDVPVTLQVSLGERADEFPGVDVKRESVRVYPQGMLLAQVLGYTGRISKDEYATEQGLPDSPKDNPKTYQPDSEIGKAGLEKAYEDDLRGTPGKCEIEVDARGKPVHTNSCTPAVPGNDLVLTIDSKVQLNLEQNLASQLLSIRNKFTKDGKAIKSPAGSGVVMDPRNGAVLAMASFPTYDPSEFVNGISQARYDQLRNPNDPAANPFINRAIAGQYEPGSTFKLITANAALSQGLINGNSSINDTGKFTFGNQSFAGPDGDEGAGPIALPQALTISNDFFFYSLGARYTRERATWGDGIQQTARQFGLGAASGIPLGGEGTGFVLTPEDKNNLHKNNPSAYPYEYEPGDSVQIAIGQNLVTVTPLQLANAYAAFSQHGVRYQPNLMLAVVKPGGSVTNPADIVRTNPPTETARFPIPDAVYNPIMAGLTGVPGKSGTAGEAFAGFDLAAYPIAGKTGTAEVEKTKADTSLFVGFGPGYNPQYVAAVVLEQSGFGADAAAPVVRHVFDQLANPLAAFVTPGPPAGSPEATTTTTAPGTAIAPGTAGAPYDVPTAPPGPGNTTLPPTSVPTGIPKD